MRKPTRIDKAVDRRRSQLAMIHVARKHLGMDEDTYRAVIRRVSVTAGNRVECSSSADLDGEQRHAVVDEFRRLGAKLPPMRGTRGPARVGQHPGKPGNIDNEPMLKKIEAQLADMELPWSYADTIAKQQTGIARVAWLRKEPQLAAVIAALHTEQRKRALAKEVSRLVERLHISKKQLAELTVGMPKKWDRNIASLEWLITQLQARELLLDANPSS